MWTNFRISFLSLFLTDKLQFQEDDVQELPPDLFKPLTQLTKLEVNKVPFHSIEIVGPWETN